MKRLSFCLSLILIFTMLPWIGIRAESTDKHIYLELFAEANKNLESDSAKFNVSFDLNDTSLEAIRKQRSELLENMRSAIKEAGLHSINMIITEDRLSKHSELDDNAVSNETDGSTASSASEDSSPSQKNIKVEYIQTLVINFTVDDTKELLPLSNLLVSFEPSYVGQITYLQKDKSASINETRKMAIDNARTKAKSILSKLLKSFDDNNLEFVSIKEQNEVNMASPRSNSKAEMFSTEATAQDSAIEQDMTGQEIHNDSLRIVFAYNLKEPASEYSEEILNKFSAGDSNDSPTSSLIWAKSNDKLALDLSSSALYSSGEFISDDFASILNFTLSTDNHENINEAQDEANNLRNTFLTDLKNKFADTCEILNESFNTQGIFDYRSNNDEPVSHYMDLSYSLLVKDPKVIDEILNLASNNALSYCSNPLPFKESVNEKIAEALYSSIDSNINKLVQVMDKDTFLSKNLLLSESMSSASISKDLDVENNDKWSLNIFSYSDLSLLD